MRVSYAKRVTQPAGQCLSFKVDLRSLPRIGKGERFFLRDGREQGRPLIERVQATGLKK